MQAEALLFTDLGTGKSGKGNKFANYILGNSLDNTLKGGDGNDTLQGAVGADSLLGGKGDDIYFVTDANDKIVENSDEGLDHVTSMVDFSLLALGTSVENLALGEPGGAITGIGSNSANAIVGNSKNNNLFGLNENDSIASAAGDDSIDGGAGNDRYLIESTFGKIIEAAGDKIVEGKGGGSDAVHSFVDYTLAAEVETLFLDSGTNGTGNALNNSLLGNASANKLSGLAGGDFIVGKDGNDTLLGGVGDDNLIGGADNDSMVGGAGNHIYSVEQIGDIIFESAGQGIDYVESSLPTYTPGANLEKLNLVGATAVTGIGNGLDNLIYGANSVPVGNVLRGAAGNDTLNGNAEADTLTGGTGHDHFQSTATDAVDRVTDFEAGALGDTLYLSDLLTGYVPGSSDPNLFVQFVTGGGNTTVRVDADGAGGGSTFQDVAVLEGVTLNNVNQAVLEGNLELA